MKNAERRFEEVEERLRSVEAPEPPPHLLESLVEEIPDESGAARAEPQRDGGEMEPMAPAGRLARRRHGRVACSGTGCSRRSRSTR